MKKYDPAIEAANIVQQHTQHGVSRRDDAGKNRDVVTSVMTEKAHMRALKGCAVFVYEKFDGKRLKNLSAEQAGQYLQIRAATCKQSTLNLDRQALNFHFFRSQPLEYLHSKVPTVPRNRAYTDQQIELLMTSSPPELRLSIALSVDAGLRSMELVSIASLERLVPSDRRWDECRFVGRETDHAFAVHGKGKLIRQVRLQPENALRLVELQRPAIVTISHRGANLKSHFELLAGHRFSLEFGKLSMEILGFSLGSHGLRHTFAQRRRNTLLAHGFSIEHGIKILSQELGHFSTKNTLAYLRDMNS